VDDIARHLGVARDTIYRWIEAPGLPAHRVGKLWKFKVSEIDAWVKTDRASDGEGSRRRKPAKGRRR
jgi:excisionase family DNA binding protein